jgi:hypothetical protein
VWEESKFSHYYHRASSRIKGNNIKPTDAQIEPPKDATIKMAEFVHQLV